jgi:hypothetical protein
MRHCDPLKHWEQLLTHWYSITPHETWIFSSFTVGISSHVTLFVICLNLSPWSWRQQVCLKYWHISTKLHMSHPFILIVFRWRYECELFDLQGATVLSLDCSTHLYILSCTLTTCLLLWDHSTRNISGGRSTSLLSRWLVASQVIKCIYILRYSHCTSLITYLTLFGFSADWPDTYWQLVF